MRNSKINIILILFCIFLCICAVCISLIDSKIDDTKSAKNINKTNFDTITNQENYREISKWEELSVSEQFGLCNYNNNIYQSQRTKIAKENIEKKIGNETLKSYDLESYYELYNESKNVNSHSKKAELFSIEKISEECAIALKFEGGNDYYVYVNSYYKPETLGQFMKDANLREITSFGTVSYKYQDKDSGEFREIKFYDVDNEIIWNKLFSNRELRIDDEYTNAPEKLISTDKYNSKDNVQEIGISVNIPLLGYKNISVILTDRGYLITNILDSGKCFYIGENTVNEFWEYIRENYDDTKVECE